MAALEAVVVAVCDGGRWLLSPHPRLPPISSSFSMVVFFSIFPCSFFPLPPPPSPAQSPPSDSIQVRAADKDSSSPSPPLSPFSSLPPS